MRKLIKIFLLLIFFQASAVWTAEETVIPEGKINSPYDACKNVVIVSKSKYKENQANWDQTGKNCNLKIQVSTDAGLSSIDPLKQGVQYLEFSQRVARKVLENLDKSRKYADCSANCFSGARACPAALADNNKVVQCSERKKEIQNGMLVYSRKIRMELALSNDAPGIVNVNVRNILTVDKNKFINSDLRDFEIGTPNPVGRTELTPRELKEAQRRVERDRVALENEYKEKGYKNYADWMSVKLVQKFDEHRDRYRQLIYEEAPIFSVIDQPAKFENDSDPAWSDAQMAKAFRKLSENSKTTQEIVNTSLNRSKLEFQRATGEAFGRWLTSLAPGTKEQNDLLFYIGMKGQVEDVLKNDPSSCAIATAMEARLHSKAMQNAGITFAVTFVSSSLLKGASSITGNVFRIGRALTGAEATALSGIALGAINIGDSFRKYNIDVTEVATLSGLGGDQEGKSFVKAETLTLARDNVKSSLMYAPVGTGGGWAMSKTFYASLSKQMEKDLPGISDLLKRAKLDEVARDEAVDIWLVEKIKSAVKSGLLSKTDNAALKSNEARVVLESLTVDIERSNAQFFRNPKNMDFFLKTAAKTIQKEKGDPADLGAKAKQLLLHFNTDAINGSGTPGTQYELLKIFDNAIIELRLSAKNDPATYAKFSTSQESQEKILLNALRRSGVKTEADAKGMLLKVILYK